MEVLGIETTGKYCSVAISSGRGKVEEMGTDEGFKHLQSLAPMMKELLDKRGMTLEDVDVLALSIGPGSFTGIRIGVGTARAICQTGGVKVLPVGTLPAFAWSRLERGWLVCPILDARRGQIYGGGYAGATGEKMEELIEAGPYMLKNFLERVRERMETDNIENVIFVGDGTQVYGEMLDDWKTTLPNTWEFKAEKAHQGAAGVVSYSQFLLESGEDLTENFGDIHPQYMRLAEAERKLLEKEIRFRVATEKDWEAIYELESQNFQDGFKREAMEKEICENKLACYVVAEYRGEILGYSGLWAVEPEGHITNICVRDDRRRQGIGRAMVTKLMEEGRTRGLSKFTLELRASNAKALALYEKLGFQREGRRLRYYRDNGEDAIVMWKY